MDNKINVSTIADPVDNARALVIFAHGAGADMEHDYMQDLAHRLNLVGLNVLRFNFPYMDKRKVDGKRRPPDRMPTLLACYQAVLAAQTTKLPIFIGGKSMGGRVAATLAQNIDCGAKGVFCLGYPFHPQKKPEKLRLEPLQQTQLPLLILQGQRDALGNEVEINDYSLSALVRVEIFADGDHSLKPRVKSGFSLDQHLDHAVNTLARFIDENC